MSGWTQPCCGCCWQAYSYGHFGEIREPVKMRDEFVMLDTCCFCGGQAEQGIYVRADPNIVPFPQSEN